MINFKSFLTEARMAPLYHGTLFLNAEAIFSSKAILPKTEHPGKKLLLKGGGSSISGVSTTRSLSFAKKWGGDVIFELDQQKLIQKYKIIPINYWQNESKVTRDTNQPYKESFNNEYEEFILTDKPIPLGYVTKVWLLDRYVDSELREKFIKYFGKDNVKII